MNWLDICALDDINAEEKMNRDGIPAIRPAGRNAAAP